MFQFQTEDKPIALASALTYWVFRCRDKGKTPAMGTKTWEYLQSSIENAAIPSRSLNDYLVHLSKKLIVPTLRPKEWNRLINPQQVVLRANRDEYGELGEIQERTTDQTLVFEGWEDILKKWSMKYGITERTILQQGLTKAQIITLYCRLKFEEDRTVIEEETETIDV